MLYPKRRHKTIISKRSVNLAGFQRQKESQIIKNAVETNIYCLYSFQNRKLSEGAIEMLICRRDRYFQIRHTINVLSYEASNNDGFTLFMVVEKHSSNCSC